MLKSRSGGRVGLRIALMAAASGFAVQAAAQTAREGMLEELVVTARRTTENLSEVPVTVNVLTSEAVERKGVQSLSDISGLAPNVVWETRGGSVRNRVAIRGISSNDNNTGVDPGIGFYVDDVYLSHGIGFNQSLLDIDRIEVLKGPQGTLFGRNTTAGVIAVYTRRPSTTERYLDVAAAAGNYESRNIRAVGNIPLGDDMGLKLSGVFKERQGFETNIVDGSHANGEHHYGGRAQLLYAPSDAFDALLSAEYFKDDAPQDLVECSGGFCSSGTNTDFVLEANAPNKTTRTMWGASLAMNWRHPSGATVTSISAYRRLKAHEFQDQDGLRLDLTHSGFDLPKDWQLSQELRLSTPADKPLHGVVGLYYLHEFRDSATPQDFTPLFISLGNGVPIPAQGASVLTLNRQETDSYAVFGQGSYDFTSKLTGEIGLRYTHDSKDFTFAQQVSGTNVCGARGAVAFCPFPQFSGSKSWSAVSATASLRYRITEGLMTFARYSRGYKSGGWNGAQLSAGTDPTKPYDPEYLDNYEVGLKFESPDHRIRFNAAAFYIEYSDLQLRFQDPTTFAYTFKNAGDARSQGAEFELSWLPLDALEIDANVGVTDTKITRVDSSPILTALRGKEFPFAPKTTASATATWTHPVGERLQAVASGTVAYRDSIWLDNANAMKSGAYTSLAGRVGVEAQDRRWGLYLSGQNLTDVNRLAFFVGNSPVAGRIGVPNAPCTWQVELKARF